MRYKLLVLIALFSVCSKVEVSNSSLVDVEKTQAAMTADVDLQECDSANPDLDFYPRQDKKAVGFNVNCLEDYQKLKYEIAYNHDSIKELAQGEVLLNGKKEHKEEWIILGTCSDEGIVCVYNENIGKIKLFLKLIKENGEHILITRELSL